MKRIVAVALVLTSLATTSAHALDFKLKDGSYISGGKINVSFTVTFYFLESLGVQGGAASFSRVAHGRGEGCAPARMPRTVT